MIYESNNFRPIIELIEKKLINPKEGIDFIYKNLSEFSLNNIPKHDLIYGKVDDIVNSPLLDLLKSYGINLTTISLDVPIFLKSKKENTETIMICAMDPLSPEEKNDKKNNDFKNNIGFWMPFSLLEQKSSSNKAFFTLLLEECNLYITDIFKLFFRKKDNLNASKSSNKLPQFKNLSIHRELINNEIEIIKPKVIITLGNNARDNILKLNKSDNKIIKNNWEVEPLQISKWNNEVNIISIPHISKSANGSIAFLLRMFPNLYQENDSQNTKIAKIVMNKI